MLGTDDKLWVSSGEGSGHVTRNVRLALAVVDLVEVGREGGSEGRTRNSLTLTRRREGGRERGTKEVTLSSSFYFSHSLMSTGLAILEQDANGE